MATAAGSSEQNYPIENQSSNPKSMETFTPRTPRKTRCQRRAQREESSKPSPSSPYPKAMIPVRSHVFECVVCRRAFSRKDTLKNHFRIHLGDHMVRCSRCTRASSWRSIIAQTHNYGLTPIAVGKALISRRGPFKCEICGVKFRFALLLEKHIAEHEDDDIFECCICGKAFADKSDMLTHIENHPRDRPYRCDTCGVALFPALQRSPPGTSSTSESAGK